MSRDNAALALLEQALLNALTLAHEQGDMEVVQSLSATLDSVRARRSADPDETAD